MRDRLIELLKETRCEKDCDGFKNAEFCKACTAYERCAESADHLLTNGVIALPCKVGDWIWYVYRNEINKAKVEEIQYDASKHGYYSYNFSIYAYDFKNKRQVAYHPINETTKNKSNINGVEGMDFGEDVYIFLSREEAEQALRGDEG